MTAPSTTFYIKQNDSDPIIVEYMRNADGTAISLVGASVRFHMLAADGTVKVNAAATIQDDVNGKVSYSWVAADTDTAGIFSREWVITLSTGRVVTVPNDQNYPVVITDDIA